MKRRNKCFLCSEILFRFFIYILPGVLFFSYQPLIHLGSSESMNFELSLPLIWLVLFDLLVTVMLVRRRKFWKGILEHWVWLLLPAWLSVSVLWSLNPLRGLLTVGILWLLYLAGYGFWSLRSLFDEVGVREKFWKVFFGSTLVVCAWCLLQCVLDLVGVSREASLMCAGCTYAMFGFPHPNGFAIEPQFMGNLLLAPVITVAWLLLKRSGSGFLGSKLLLFCFFIISATLFLTFSRGAIYAFVVGMVVMTVWEVWRSRKWRAMVVWPVVVLAFLFTLNLQGIMAQASKTDDTYFTGVSKVLNHLSLGVIDIEVNDSGSVGATDGTRAAFDGYVAESTDTRLRLSGAALEVWHQDFATVMFGVGLGGAGQALYVNGLSPAPKEIVQNQYASLLLESGVVGVCLVVFSLGLVMRVMWRSPWRVALISLILAYMVSLCFFSGLPNALHIYLLPAVVYVLSIDWKGRMGDNGSKKRRKNGGNL